MFSEATESTSGRNVTASGKFAFTWSDSGRLIPDVNSSDPGQLASQSNHNRGFNSEDMNSVYSDAGDTFASLSFGDYNEGDASVSPYPAERSDENSRDFIMRRFLPAAQALTNEAALPTPPSLMSKPSPFAHRWTSSKFSWNAMSIVTRLAFVLIFSFEPGDAGP